MFKFRNSLGAVSKTVVVAWLEILAALILMAAEFVKAGDFSTYAALILANGIVMLVLRHYTDSALA